MEINLHEAHQNSHLELLAKQVVEGFITGLHKSPFHGFSVEFAEHRIYNEGESTKNIDWKLFARTEKLFSKRYEEETNLRCQLVIDNSSSMHYPDAKSLEKGKRNKIMFSVHAAASIMNILKRQRDAVGMSVFSDKVEEHTPARSSTRHHKLLIHTLEQALASSAGLTKKTSAASAIHEIAENVNKRSLVLIFSDMMDSAGNDTDELFNALQHLKYNKHEVILFHVVDKEKEIDFDFENRPYQFIDVETGEKVKVHSNKVREAYHEAIQKYTKDLKLKCAQYKIDFVEADINQGYKQVLMPYLIKRQKMP